MSALAVYPSVSGSLIGLARILGASKFSNFRKTARCGHAAAGVFSQKNASFSAFSRIPFEQSCNLDLCVAMFSSIGKTCHLKN
jgi:hypothetical protein